MAVAIIASVAPTLAALAAWWGTRKDPAALMRVEAMVNEMMDWQCAHERKHRGGVL